MKIGILTFHCAHNYGAVLQCYALQETLRGMGYEVEVINYQPEYIRKVYKVINLQRIRSKNPLKVIFKIIKELILLPKRYKRHRAFNNFINTKIKLSPGIFYLNKEIPSNYDRYVIGSDQVWNSLITNGFDPTFLGHFTFPKKSKKYISYAVSTESKAISKDSLSFLEESLKNFDAISVRENWIAQILQPLTKKEIHITIDPTLLINAEIWNKLIHKSYTKYPYILIYQVRENENTRRIANELCIQLKCKIIEIGAYVCTYKRAKDSRTIIDATPEDFLTLIKNASCVVTSSFHGTIFSILFKKDFYCLELNDGADSRSASLLSQLKLTNRLITKDETPSFSHVVYNDDIDKNIADLRAHSMAFLRNSL